MPLKEFIIKNVDNYNYRIVDTDNKSYDLNIEFYDLKKNPNIGDTILMSEELLKTYKESGCFFRFGNCESEYTRQNDTTDNIEVKIDDKTILLKRWYG